MVTLPDRLLRTPTYGRLQTQQPVPHRHYSPEVIHISLLVLGKMGGEDSANTPPIFFSRDGAVVYGPRVILRKR